MATDKIINESQGNDIIDKLDDIADKIHGINYGVETSSNKVVQMTAYQKSTAATPGAISTGDTLNEAVGKLEKRIDGAAQGPVSSVDEHLVMFDGTSGKAVKDSGITIADSEDGMADSDTQVPTSKNVMKYVDKSIGTNLPLGPLGRLNRKKNNITTKTWKTKTWGGTELSWGKNMWSDGENIYYSAGVGWQYVLDRSTDTWIVKEWNITIDYGTDIWSDGTNVYYSSTDGTNQFVLDKSTGTWINKSWTGLTTVIGQYVWTDGDNIYYSNSSDQYVLDKSTSTWSVKSWTGLTSFYGSNVWTDGKNYYHSYYSNSTTPATNQQYVLDKSTSTWTTKTWNGTMTGFTGNSIWTDGESVYYSSGTFHRKLDVATSTWSTISWSGVSKLYGEYIWSDGKHIYFDYRDTSVTPSVYYNYVLDSVDPTRREVMGYVDETAPSTMGASGTNHKGGLVPDTPSTAGTTKYLCENGSWTVPPGNLSVTYGGASGTYAETLIFSRG